MKKWNKGEVSSMNQNEKNIIVFEDTEKRCKQHAVLKKAIKTVCASKRVYNVIKMD